VLSPSLRFFFLFRAHLRNGVGKEDLAPVEEADRALRDDITFLLAERPREGMHEFAVVERKGARVERYGV
jgi:hypothetical protein